MGLIPVAMMKWMEILNLFLRGRERLGTKAGEFKRERTAVFSEEKRISEDRK